VSDVVDPLWSPSADRIAEANLTRFMTEAGARSGRTFTGYDDLWQWSVDDRAAFWDTLWDFCGVIGDKGERLLDDGDRMPGAHWFPEARLNFAENLLRFRDERPALVFRGEDGTRLTLTYDGLYRQVAGVAAALRGAGVGQGDCVAGYLPNHPQTVVAMLATASLGATWSSCSPDFGIQGVIDRFGQIEPKVLFTADGYHYAGKKIDSLQSVRDVVAKIGSVQLVVVVPFLEPQPDLTGIPHAVLLGDFIAPDTSIEFTRLPFDHPLYVMYSSGTTGTPTCIVHGAGGTLLQHLKEHQLHTDLRRDDVLFYFTTCGWMMWNWLVSGLATGATLVLYDGSPFHPGARTLWQMAAEEQVTVFGTSAKYLAAIEKVRVKPARSFDLTHLRAILSTGSPLLPESYDYVYREIGSDLQLASISGGTDIVSCFALGNPIGPVYRGELQCRGLGLAVAVCNETGAVVQGQKGELVCTKPFPSMPVGFWNDPDGSRYHDAYFNRFPNTWCHGDYAELTPRGGLVIYGRSDAVLNPGGVRIGTAEIYRQVEKLDDILESIAVGQQWQGDVRVVLFVKLREGVEFDEDLQKRIRGTIRDNTTPRHVPAKILAVTDIPRTISGKIVELAVRKVIHGQPIDNTDALANPEALEQFRDRPELQE